MRRLRSEGVSAVLTAVAALLLAACASIGGGPDVTDARLGEPTGPNAALYFTATSGGDADRLLGASTSVAAEVQIHETTMRDDGTMGMQGVGVLDLPAGGSLVLEPGGYHMMLIDADRLVAGDTIEVTLEWETAGDQTVEVEVVDPAETLGHG